LCDKEESEQLVTALVEQCKLPPHRKSPIDT